jgi:hypothetical protein
MRQELLRSVFVAFNAFSELSDDKQRFMANYTQLRTKVQVHAKDFFEHQLLVYGLVCFILGNTFSRHAMGLPYFIDQRSEEVALGNEESLAPLNRLRDEQELLRKAYCSFCEIVVGPLLGEVQTGDFGNEWLVDDSEPVPLEAAREALKSGQAAHNEERTGQEKSDPLIDQFLDGLAALSDLSLRTGLRTLALRVADKGVCVSVGEYSSPSESDPSRPQILRITILPLPMAEKASKGLGLPLNSKHRLHCRLELSCLPEELLELVPWTDEWIRGQESQAPNGPCSPIPLAEYQSLFSSPADDSSEWLGVDYLWSSAAKRVYKEWEEKT